MRFHRVAAILALGTALPAARADVEHPEDVSSVNAQPAGTFRIASHSLQAHSGGALFRYVDGRLFLISGSGAELWNPRTRQWHRVDLPDERRNGFARERAVQLPNGEVVLIGGFEPGTRPPAAFDANIWEPRRERWKKALHVVVPRILHTATVRSDGTVVIAGGGIRTDVRSPYPLLTYIRPIESTELISGEEATAGPRLNVPRLEHFAVALANDDVVVIGGIGSQGEVLSSVERLNRAARAWEVSANLETARFDSTAVVLSDGRVLVIGGRDSSRQPLASVEIFDPVSGNWRTGPSLPLARAGTVAVVLKDSSVLLAGGSDSNDRPVEEALLLPAHGDQWQSAGRAALGHAPAVLALDDGDVLLAGSDRAVYRWSSRPIEALQAMTRVVSADPNANDFAASSPLMPFGPGAPLRRLDPDEFLQPRRQSALPVSHGAEEPSLRHPAVFLMTAGALGGATVMVLIPVLLPVAGVVLYRRLHRRKQSAGAS